jgi:hypothetical protein
LNELRDEVASLRTHDAREISFKTVANRWQQGSVYTVKESTAKRRKRRLNHFSLA